MGKLFHIIKILYKCDECRLERYSNSLSEEFIRILSAHLNWRLAFQYYKLPESFIKRFAELSNCFIVSKYQTLSEPFIENPTDDLVWDHLISCQTMSEPFTEQHMSWIHWLHIYLAFPITKNSVKPSTGKLQKVYTLYISLSNTDQRPRVRFFR